MKKKKGERWSWDKKFREEHEKQRCNNLASFQLRARFRSVPEDLRTGKASNSSDDRTRKRLWLCGLRAVRLNTRDCSQIIKRGGGDASLKEKNRVPKYRKRFFTPCSSLFAFWRSRNPINRTWISEFWLQNFSAHDENLKIFYFLFFLSIFNRNCRFSYDKKMKEKTDDFSFPFLFKYFQS